MNAAEFRAQHCLVLFHGPGAQTVGLQAVDGLDVDGEGCKGCVHSLRNPGRVLAARLIAFNLVHQAAGEREAVFIADAAGHHLAEGVHRIYGSAVNLHVGACVVPAVVDLGDAGDPARQNAGVDGILQGAYVTLAVTVDDAAAVDAGHAAHAGHTLNVLLHVSVAASRENAQGVAVGDQCPVEDTGNAAQLHQLAGFFHAPHGDVCPCIDDCALEYMAADAAQEGGALFRGMVDFAGYDAVVNPGAVIVAFGIAAAHASGDGADVDAAGAVGVDADLR